MQKQCIILFFCTLVLHVPALTQGRTEGRLQTRDALQLMQQIDELLEATRIIIPELSRAGAPLRENFHQGFKTLETSSSRNHVGVMYKMLWNARTYLLLTDNIPKPVEFRADIQQQLVQLREHLERFDTHFVATLDYREQQLLGGDRDNLKRYSEDNRLISPDTLSQERVVFLGDSITDGWKLNQYFTGKPYVNRGISGQITGQMLGRMKLDVLDLKPRAVVILAGTNDLARGVTDETIRSNLEMIGILAEAAGIRPVFASILPINDYFKDSDPRFLRSQSRNPDRIQNLNLWLARTCKEKKWVYLDYFQSMVDASGQLKKELSQDGLHPNTAGYKIMTPLAEEAIKLTFSKSRRGIRNLFR